MDYKEALDFLYAQLPMYQRVGAKAFKKDLTNTLKLSSFLGDPHNSFKSIHIAGTNGKGTTAHSIASILQEAGLKVGLYTSPHLKSFRERIRINGEAIEEEFIVDFVERIMTQILEIKPSFFEITVVMAFEYFAQKNVEVAIIETGLGGRLDSTNIITPLLSIITSIGYDHQDMLGDSLEEIAGEKAGIVKANTPVVLGLIEDKPKSVIVEKAQQMNSKVIDEAQHWSFIDANNDSYRILKNDELIYDDINLSIPGQYFKKNFPAVLEAVLELNIQGFQLNENHVRKGICNTVVNTGLKGRWQILSEHPLTICDIGHNEDGISSIVRQLQKMQYSRLHFVFGTVKDKNLENILTLLIKEADYYFCQAKVPRALPIEELMEEAARFGLKGRSYDSVENAIKAAQTEANEDDLIFIGGSTFVVAEIENL